MSRLTSRSYMQKETVGFLNILHLPEQHTLPNTTCTASNPISCSPTAWAYSGCKESRAKAMISHMLYSRIRQRLMLKGFLTVYAPTVHSCSCTIPLFVPIKAHLCNHGAGEIRKLILPEWALSRPAQTLATKAQGRRRWKPTQKQAEPHFTTSAAAKPWSWRALWCHWI